MVLLTKKITFAPSHHSHVSKTLHSWILDFAGEVEKFAARSARLINSYNRAEWLGRLPELITYAFSVIPKRKAPHTSMPWAQNEKRHESCANAGRCDHRSDARWGCQCFLKHLRSEVKYIARRVVTEYIDQFFNPTRRPSTYGYLSPLMSELCRQTRPFTVKSTCPQRTRKRRQHNDIT